MTVHIVVTRELPASCAAAFDLVHDYDRRLEWDTLLRAARVEGQPIDRGSIGVCTAKRRLGGFSFRFRYVTFRRPELAAVTLISRAPFFRTWAASIRHEPLPDGRSTVCYTMTFGCRPALLEPLARAMFRRETRRRLDALVRALGYSPTAPSSSSRTTSS
ncbi:MAG: type II toxin-antitoxin system RatA family toxin [Jatrophihabitans sp.]